MYKLTRLNGKDFYSNTVDYAGNIGRIIRVTDYDFAEVGSCGKGLHASKNPNDCFIGANIPCRAFKVKGIQKITGDSHKVRYQALKIIEEINKLNDLFGWNYNEAINPIHPFELKPPKITKQYKDMVQRWDSMWTSVRDSVGDSVRAYIGSLFPNIKKWNYIEHKPGSYPYQDCVNLWKKGLVPSFDGKLWRLHGGLKSEILAEFKF